MNEGMVLIVEDDPDGAQSVKDAVEECGFHAALATKGMQGVDIFQSQEPDLVLSDLVLPDIDGIEVLARIKRVNPDVPILIMTAYGSVESSVKAMQAGAYDYVPKPLDLDDLQGKLTRAYETSNLRRKVSALSQNVRERYGSHTIIAKSLAMQEVMQQVKALAPTTATVLIRGESGTGKELVARALHADSPRAEEPFVAVNCGAFAESLLESELFGHEKGAFTGAAAQHKGAFERAAGGTLFLDEIGDAPAPVQVKLLRALEEREIRRIGGQQSFHVDVRMLSATNRDLKELVENGVFREDLLYRIDVVGINIPPLRRRIADIRPMTDRFVAAACEQHGRRITNVESSFYERLQAQEWPGNVRQLRNVVESAVILATSPVLNGRSIKALDAPHVSTAESKFRLPENMSLEEIEREVLTQALRRHEGNRTLTAEKLGLSRRTIQRKIQEHDLPF